VSCEDSRRKEITYHVFSIYTVDISVLGTLYHCMFNKTLG